MGWEFHLERWRPAFSCAEGQMAEGVWLQFRYQMKLPWFQEASAHRCWALQPAQPSHQHGQGWLLSSPKELNLWEPAIRAKQTNPGSPCTLCWWWQSTGQSQMLSAPIQWLQVTKGKDHCTIPGAQARAWQPGVHPGEDPMDPDIGWHHHRAPQMSQGHAGMQIMEHAEKCVLPSESKCCPATWGSAWEGKKPGAVSAPCGLQVQLESQWREKRRCWKGGRKATATDLVCAVMTLQASALSSGKNRQTTLAGVNGRVWEHRLQHYTSST